MITDKGVNNFGLAKKSLREKAGVRLACVMSSIVLGQFNVGAVFPAAVDDSALGPGFNTRGCYLISLSRSSKRFTLDFAFARLAAAAL
jgi:hypothetical protein